MKKILFISSLLLFVLSSCSKQQYCAQCSTPDYIADDFCGNTDEVDDYIESLYSNDFLGWTCYKVEE
tara:strand:+ start:675 stop:875 length:201 start_codon:yes stop_codon:yes gene_type:complete